MREKMKRITIIVSIFTMLFTSILSAEELYEPKKLDLNDKEYHRIDEKLFLDRTTVTIINEKNQNNEPVEIITGTISVVDKFPDGVYALPSLRVSILASNCAIVYKDDVGDHNEKMLLSFLNGKPLGIYDVDFKDDFDKKIYRLLCFLGNSKIKPN